MPRPKKEKTIEPIVEASIEAADERKEPSQAYKIYKAHIEKYALLNPEKYEVKKEELLKKLNTLK